MHGFTTRSALHRMASAWISSPLFRVALLTAACLPSLSPAQQAPAASTSGDRYLAPQKDIAILVDVSRSVEVNPDTKSRDTNAIEDAKKIVKDLVTGRGFKSSQRYEKSDWEVKPGQDTSLNALFARYLGDSAAGPTSAELTALARPGGNLLVLPVGNLATVINNGTTTTVKSNFPSELDSLIERGYPTQMRDTSTCFWFAMARAAETLSEQSRDGYYLFVVSDEEDDPDYRADGPPGHTASDYPKYRAKLAGMWPESTIRSTIERYFINRTVNDRNVEQYTPRTGFAKTLIAKIYRRNASSRNNPISISWYAMGVVPEVIHQMPARVVEAAPPPSTFVAPKFTPRLQFLGGLGGRQEKTFDYEEPLVAWQVVNGTLSDLNDMDAGARLVVEGSGGSAPLARRLTNAGRKNRPATLQLTGLKDAPYRLKLKLDGNSGAAAEQLSIEAPIKYQPRTDFWLMVLAVTSIVAAVGIFFFAWRNLRETRVVPLS